MYLEQRMEQLEREIQELKEQRKAEQYVTPKEFAERMTCSQSFVTKMIKEGQIKALKIGKLYRIPMSQFEEKENEEDSWKTLVFKGA